MDLSSMVGGLGGADPTKLAGAIQEVFQSKGGTAGFVNQLRAGGLGDSVDSWVSTGSNEPVEPERLAQALGPETVNELATKSGLSVGQLLPTLAGVLPMVIDFLTPGGQLPKGGDAGGAGGLGDLGGMLGGMLGGATGGSTPGSSGGGGGGGLGGMLGGMLGGDKDSTSD